MPQLGIKCRFTIICLLVAILSAAFLPFPVVALDEIEQYNVDMNEGDQDAIEQYNVDLNEGDQDAIEQYNVDLSEGDQDTIQHIDELSEGVMLGSRAPAKQDDLFGDILIGEDSGNNALYPVKAGDKFTFTFRLFFNGIKKDIESRPPKTKDFKLKELEGNFTVKITLPEGMDFDGTESLKCSFTDNGLFKLNKVNIENRTITAEIELIPDKTITWTNLRDAVKNLGRLDISIPPVSISAAATPDTLLQCEGVCEGSFYIQYVIGKYTYKYKIEGPAKQLPEGRDVAIKDQVDQSKITYTVIVKAAPEEEQDILIPCPYPCQAPPMWNPQPQPSQMIQQVQPMPQAPVQNVDAAQAPIQLPKTGEKRPQPLSLYFLLSASALFLLRRKMR